MPRPGLRSSLLIRFFLTTLATSVNVLFGFLKFTNALEIKFYHFYSPKIISIMIFSPSIDFWIWIVSLLFIILDMLLIKTFKRNPSLPHWTILPCLFSLASLAIFPFNDRIAYLFTTPLGFMVAGLLIYYGDGYLVTSRKEAASLTLVCIAGLLIFFEVASVSCWTLNTLDYEHPFSPSPRWKLPWIDLQLFNVLYPLTSWLFLLFLYSWIWIPASKHVPSLIPPLKHTLQKIKRRILSPDQNTDSKLKLNNKLLILGLFISLATAVFVAYYPSIHLPSSTFAGADAIGYYESMKDMMQNGPSTALETDRPFFNLLIYSINYAVGSPETVIRIMPPILAASLSLAVFWFVRVGTGNELMALMSSLLSTFSFQTTLSVFAYVIANWFAIIETFLLLVFLLKCFENPSWKYLLTSTLIGIALLLTHPYTWNVVIAILFAYFALIFLRRDSEEKIEIAPLVLLLAANLAFYVIYSLMPFGTGVSHAEESILQYATSNIGLSSFLNLQNNLASMVQMWVGGLLGNPLLLTLAVAGMLSIMDFRKRFDRLMLFWVMVPSLALLATPPDLFYRVVYLIPIQILAATGLYWMLNKLEEAISSLKTSETFHMLKISIIILILLFLLNYSLRSVDGAVIHILEH